MRMSLSMYKTEGRLRQREGKGCTRRRPFQPSTIPRHMTVRTRSALDSGVWSMTTRGLAPSRVRPSVCASRQKDGLSFLLLFSLGNSEDCSQPPCHFHPRRRPCPTMSSMIRRARRRCPRPLSRRENDRRVGTTIAA